MKLNLNFAGRSYVNMRLIGQAYWLSAALLVVLLLWGVIQLLSTHTMIAEQDTKLAALQKDREELLGIESIALDTEKLEAVRADVVRSQVLIDQDSFHWTALFDRMENLLPDGVSLRGFRPNYKERSLDITGVAKDLNSLQTFLDQLLTDDTIETAFLQQQAETKVQDIKGTEYIALTFSVKLRGVF
ncbi:MAG: hypothetical protein C0618_01550 [Desulfuromonas sp.]|nr:MAG: hypothetical protein C0618_01550 [Desulfuromonas sp.]